MLDRYGGPETARRLLGGNDFVQEGIIKLRNLEKLICLWKQK